MPCYVICIVEVTGTFRRWQEGGRGGALLWRSSTNCSAGGRIHSKIGRYFACFNAVLKSCEGSSAAKFLSQNEYCKDRQ